MADKLVHSEANARRISCVESAFGSSGQTLTAPGRVLVGEGVLTKLCRKKPKPRQFFLFSDILVYGNILMNKKKYNKQHILPLEDVQLQSLEDDGPLRHGWQIISPKKSFAVFAATATEKSEWMAHIRKCVNDLLAKSGKKAAKDHAAVWVPDSEAPVCMVCTKTKFSAITRRHHCRKCGLVVCNKCSTKKFLLPHISNKPLRVCDNCFDVLSSQGIRSMSEESTPAMYGAPAFPVADTPDSDDDEDPDYSSPRSFIPPPAVPPKKKGGESPEGRFRSLEGSSAEEVDEEEEEVQFVPSTPVIPQFYTDTDHV